LDGTDSTDKLRENLHRVAWQWLHTAADVARDAVLGLKPEVRLHQGDPVAVLLAESETAYEVVVGSRGYSGFTGVMAGSTAMALSAHAHSPVVVVRGSSARRGPIVVGVDGSATSELAVARAFDQADLEGADLIAVHVWHPLPAWVSGIALDERDRVEMAAEHHRLLSERLAGWQEKHPDVRVERVVAEGHVAQRLVDYADTARLVVVGSRGRDGFTGLLLGSTSHALLHHAPCPVVVVRDDRLN
jgi:nucleotide-binding universal stress UspA family protein